MIVLTYTRKIIDGSGLKKFSFTKTFSHIFATGFNDTYISTH